MPYINSGNLELYYQVSGRGPAMMFLTGLLLDIRAYQKLIALFSREFRVYAVDLPFHGKTRGSADRKTILSALWKLCETENLKNPVVFGHSGGALLALEYARVHRVKKLVLSSPPGRACASATFYFLLAMVHPITSFITNPLSYLKLVPVVFLNACRNLFNRRFYDEISGQLCQIHSLANIRQEILIFWPEYDVFFPFSESGDFLSGSKNYEVIMLKTTHEWPSLCPELILKHLDKIKE